MKENEKPMSPESDQLRAVSVLTRREIEGRVIAPLVNAFADEIGSERSADIASRVIRQIAYEQGCQLAYTLGGCTLADFAKTIDAWKKGDALQIETIVQDEKRFHFNVVRCRYAELYQTLGISELGVILSCNRDEALVEGFNPDIKLHRTQTIMEGAPFCDFRFEKE
jgi:hypothetical protein